MSTFHFNRLDRFSRSRLAACVAAVLGLALANTSSAEQARVRSSASRDASQQAPATVPFKADAAANSRFAPRYSKSPLSPHVVMSCADDYSPGTLRYEVDHSFDGDTVDMSALACSVITLDPSQVPMAIHVPQDNLYLKGPAAGASHLTISGGDQSAVLVHTGVGTLDLTDLTIAHGSNFSDTDPDGGCISSLGSVSLTRSAVTHCETGSSMLHPRGGGIFTNGNLSLIASTISDSHAIGINHYSRGGGAFVIGTFSALYSMISDNSALSKYSDHTSDAGGITAFGVATVQGSTISGNSADYVGGLSANLGGTIRNSTISDNNAALGYGGIWSYGPLEVTNATVAFNTAGVNFSGSGLLAYTTLTLKSSIVADNSNANGPSDLGGFGGAPTGAYNLITSSTLPPLVDTITACPQLQPLADTGGSIKTHALSHTSPAIDMGKNVAGLQSDERLFGRVWGADADIGSVEWHPTDVDERIMADAFDGVCD